MLESIWNLFSFDLLPTLPIKFNLIRFIFLIIFVSIPSIIAYLKQSIKRYRIHIFVMMDFLLFYFCIFVPVEDMYFDRGDLTIFAKTLYVLLFLFSVLDSREGTDRWNNIVNNFKNIKNSALKYIHNLNGNLNKKNKPVGKKNAKTKNNKK